MLVTELTKQGPIRSEQDIFAVLAACDRLTSAVMWTVAHMTYARRVDFSGAPLSYEAFKVSPEGH
ncbi:hypothetical protein ABTC62_20085, partial [Acinetobacter baumannii]